MSICHTCIDLGGDETTHGICGGVELKGSDELFSLGVHSKADFLLHAHSINQMTVHCYFGNFVAVITLAEKYRSANARRIFEFYSVFYEGIAALHLARSTNLEKWRQMGESAIERMSLLLQHSCWNFENKLLCLQAEMEYVNNNHCKAEHLYKAAIASACAHKFIHEEALAHELYGRFCLENRMIDNATEQLNQSLKKYIQWGALVKAQSLQTFISRNLNMII